MEFNIPEEVNHAMKRLGIVMEQKSKDDTIHKMVFYNKVTGGSFEACSFIRSSYEIFDICFSIMAGCSMGCKICATSYSKKPYERMLDFTEILAQICFAIKKRLDDFKAFSKLTITFMGNGEPFLNLFNVIKTIENIRIFSPIPIRGYNISTVGASPNKILDLAKLTVSLNEKIKLQFSLTSMDSYIRKRLLPRAKSLANVLPYLDKYAEITKIPIKYNVPLIQGINNSQKHLESIADFILKKPLLRTLKISHYNTFSGCPYIGCTDDEIYQAFEYFISRGVQTKIFLGDRSAEIYATCGLMRIISEEDAQHVV